MSQFTSLDERFCSLSHRDSVLYFFSIHIPDCEVDIMSQFTLLDEILFSITFFSTALNLH